MHSLRGPTITKYQSMAMSNRERRTHSRPMFSLIFQSLCAHKISFVQHFIRLVCVFNDVYEICAKTFLEGTFMCAPSFLVRADCALLMACVHTHAGTA